MQHSPRTMPEDEFWQLIDILAGSTDEAAVARLTEALRIAGKQKAVSFQERLAAELYELDREALCRQPVRWSDDPEGEDPIPLSDDTFLYLRADIVAQGKRVVEQVLSDPAVLLERRWDDGELLLSVAEEVSGDEIETTFSYETGVNEQHWAPAEPHPGGHGQPIVATLVSDLLVPIEEYQDMAMTIRVEPVEYAWPSWFADAVLDAAADFVDAAVRDSGGLPEALGVSQVQVHVGFGDVWQLMPAVDWKVEDDTGLGEVTQVRAEMRQSDVRSWRRPQQEAALTAVVAKCVLAVLPAAHHGRAQLEKAVTAAAGLLPTGA